MKKQPHQPEQTQGKTTDNTIKKGKKQTNTTRILSPRTREKNTMKDTMKNNLLYLKSGCYKPSERGEIQDSQSGKSSRT